VSPWASDTSSALVSSSASVGFSQWTPTVHSSHQTQPLAAAGSDCITGCRLHFTGVQHWASLDVQYASVHQTQLLLLLPSERDKQQAAFALPPSCAFPHQLQITHFHHLVVLASCQPLVLGNHTPCSLCTPTTSTVLPSGDCCIICCLPCRVSQEQMGGLYTSVNPVHIYPTSRMVSNYSGMMVQPHRSIVGANAFAHEAACTQVELRAQGGPLPRAVRCSCMSACLGQLVLGPSCGSTGTPTKWRSTTVDEQCVMSGVSHQWKLMQ